MPTPWPLHPAGELKAKADFGSSPNREGRKGLGCANCLICQSVSLSVCQSASLPVCLCASVPDC